VVTGVSELREALTAERARLMRAIEGVTEQQFKKRPDPTSADPQPWCIAEVLAHLLLDERVWTNRIRAAVKEDGAGVEPTDREAQDVSVRAARQAPVPQVIHGLLAGRRDLEQALEATMEAGLQRSVIQPQRGQLTIEWMVRKVIEHEREHIAQIEALRSIVGATAAAGERP
jgi:hypothetical protein